MVDAKFGPAMAALNPRQRSFVDYLVSIGGGKGDQTEAYVKAGYEVKSREVAQAASSRLMKDDRIIAAIREECERRLTTEGLTLAVRGMLTVLRDPSHKDFAKLATHVASIAGISPVSKSQVEHRHVVDLGDQFRADCAALGIDPEELLHGRMQNVTPEKVAPLQIEHAETMTIEEVLRSAGIEP